MKHIILKLKGASIRLLFLITALISLLNYHSYSQELQYSHPRADFVSNVYGSDSYSKTFDSLPDVTKRAKEMAFKHMKEKTQEHFENFTFFKAIEYDLERLFSERQEDIYKRDHCIPKYGFVFIWRDSTLGIARQYIILKLDSYGQIVDLNFPDLSHIDSMNFTTLDRAKKLADSVIEGKGCNVKMIGYSLNYNRSDKEFCWTFTYKTESTLKVNDRYKVYISLFTESVKIIQTLDP